MPSRRLDVGRTPLRDLKPLATLTSSPRFSSTIRDHDFTARAPREARSFSSTTSVSESRRCAAAQMKHLLEVPGENVAGMGIRAEGSLTPRVRRHWLKMFLMGRRRVSVWLALSGCLALLARFRLQCMPHPQPNTLRRAVAPRFFGARDTGTPIPSETPHRRARPLEDAADRPAPDPVTACRRQPDRADSRRMVL